MVTDGAKRGSSFIRYLTYSNEDEKWQFVCTDAGYNEIQPRVSYPPNKQGHPGPFKPVASGRTLNEYQMIYITRGSGMFETSGRALAVQPGSILIVFPGVRHHYKPDFAVGWTEYWVGFRGSYVDTLRNEGFISPDRPQYAIGLQNSVLTTFTQIFEEVQTQKPLYQPKVCAYILTLIAEVLSFDRQQSQHSHFEQLVERAKFVMAENIYGDINLNHIADILSVSTSHLNEVFKSYTSMTPYQYYIHIKILRAKELLDRGELSIKEVAFRLGFKDPYYFSRLFKSKTGISPSRWNSFVYQ